ncbi:MAG: mechanosensitive ion channel family protein [Saprospiraceae bacterium]|nr:mechanosensitive ion channel family protein [Saprospiraceae bacterium]
MTLRKLLLFTLTTLLSFSAFAQNNEGPEVTLQTPYNTIDVHLHYLQPDSYEPGKSAQAIYGITDSVRAQNLAIKLKQVLDGKGLYVQMNKLPQNADYVEDSSAQRQVYTLFPRELPEVYVEKIDGRWYYSEETVSNIPKLHETVYPYGTDLLLNLLPKLGQNKFLGLAVWQYLGLAFIIVISFLLHAIFSRVLSPIVKRFSSSKIYPSLIEPRLIKRIAQLLSVLLIIRIIKVLLPPLQLPIQAANFTFLVIKIVTTILIVLILLRILDIMLRYARVYTQKTDSKLDEQLMPILQRTLQSVVVVGGIIQILRLIDVDVTALIAGLSIGGLALALAAQDTVKNLFGSLTIFLDRPFQIGDWINFSGVDGTVEEVGFRSTRVRTFENSLVYVPNGRLADMIVNNYGLRVYRRFNTKINITYDTPTHIIDKFVEGLKEIVKSHPQTRKDYFEIHLNGMSSSSLDILFYIFFEVGSWSDELSAKHDILKAILDLAKTLGVSFAFPSSSIYVETFPEKGEKATRFMSDESELDTELQKFLQQYKAGLKKG